MNEKTKDVYECLQSEVFGVRVLWTLYTQLFQRENGDFDPFQERETVVTFWVFRNSLIDEIILMVGRLTDPSKTDGKTNLSLKQLIELLSSDGSISQYPQLISSLETQLTKLTDKCEKIRSYRNKTIAHNDLKTALSEFKASDVFVWWKLLSDVLPDIEREIVETLAGLSDFLNTIEQTVFNKETAYKNTQLPGESNGHSLVSLLKDGLKFRENIDSQAM
jgi:hypothetical protein